MKIFYNSWCIKDKYDNIKASFVTDFFSDVECITIYDVEYSHDKYIYSDEEGIE